MTQKTRQELLQVIGELSEECPEVRLGQLIANLATLAKGPSPSSSCPGIWDAEDEELLEAARRQLKVFRACDSTVLSCLTRGVRSPEMRHLITEYGIIV